MDKWLFNNRFTQFYRKNMDNRSSRLSMCRMKGTLDAQEIGQIDISLLIAIIVGL